MSKAATYKLSESEALLEAARNNGGIQDSGPLNKIKAQAADRFKALGIPTNRQEEWRFISLKALAETQFALPSADADASSAMEIAEGHGLNGLCESLAVFVNGSFRAGLSNLSSLPEGITVTSMAAAADATYADQLGTVAINDEHPFLALNTAIFTDGLYINVPKNTVVTQPIHILYLTTEADDPTIVAPRLLVVAEESSELTIIESFVGPDSVSYLCNPVSEFIIADNANVSHYRNQLDGTGAFHYSILDARQGRTSTFSTQTFTFGGLQTRNNSGLHMDGQGGHGTMNGLYQLTGDQVVDNHTTIDHAQPNCDTHELFKGILDDHSRGVFNGHIMVRRIAQKTDSKQTNRTLLLSSDALINTNPQLEIFADDVKCTHGATVGQLDEKQLYYLRSRGISTDEAQRMLVFAFANDCVEKVAFAPLRTLLEDKLLAQQAIKALARA